MADPRATVRQWLAARHAEAFNKCWHPYGDPCSACLVEAILTAPGVEVWAEGVAVLDPVATHPYPGVAARQRVVIRLPVEEGTGT